MNKISLSSMSWFVNPWADIILLTGFPVVFLIFYLLNRLNVYSQPLFLSVSSFLLGSLLIQPHFCITYGSAYLDSRKSQGRALQFFFVPFIFFFAMVFFSFRGNFVLFSTILFYGLFWHVLDQNYQVLQTHKLKNNDCLSFDNMLDYSVLILVPFYFLLKTLPSAGFKYSYGVVYGIPMNMLLLQFFRFFVICCLALFIIRQIYIFFKYGKINVFKIAMVATTVLIFYFSLALYANIVILLLLFRWHHNVQYAAWSLFYNRKKFREDAAEGAGVISYLSKPGRVPLYILFFVVSGCMLIVVTKTVSLLTNDPKFTVAVLQTFFALFHIYLDTFIWKTPRTPM